MNIKQNIVRIKTFNQIGSGIIYPCESDINEFDITKYIIFTNRHIINDLKDVVDEDLNKVLDIDIYDNNGNLINIDDREYVDLELFIPENANDDMKEDIAAILITFKYKLELNLVKKIMFNDNDIDDLCVEGFPQVLFNNDISSKIELKGKYKEIFPKNRKLGVFQITDDYHWYSNYKDLRLFQGFSGGPIYKKTDNVTYLVGLNQSLFNLNEGENPFKLLYYYKFYFVLEYLREKGGIIFKRNQDSSVTIRWKAQTNKNISSGEDIEKKEEDLNWENFFSSLDFSDLDKSSINILLLGASGAGKSSFVKTFLLHKDCIDSVNDGQTTRTNVVYKLSLFNQTPHAIVHFLDSSQFKELMKDLFYEKYLLKAMSAIEKKEFKDIDDCREIINKSEVCSTNKSDNDKCLDENKKKYKLEKKDLNREIERYIDKNSNEILNSDYKKFFSDLFNSSTCMFSLKEFDFINLEEIDSLLKDININLNGKDLIYFNTNINAYFSKYSEVLYREIMRKIKNNKGITDKVRFRYKPLKHITTTEFFCMEIELDNSLEKIDLLSKCLQQRNKSSLTGIIDYVEIIDSISNEYAFILDDLEIDELTIVDSVGIDHDSYYTESENILSKNLDKLISNNLISFKSDSAVIYLKKLDAGKPTELKNIIPLIFNKVPQSPVYCVFNGLDIYLGSKVGNFNGFSYMCDKPKSIKYLENAEAEILSMFKDETYFSKSLYDTLKNNISCFCCNEDILNNNFNIYYYNRKVVYDLLLSIYMKEYSCMNIIPEGFIEKIQEGSYTRNFNELFVQLYEEYEMVEKEFNVKVEHNIYEIKSYESNEMQIDQRNQIIDDVSELIVDKCIYNPYYFLSDSFKEYISNKNDLFSLSKNDNFNKFIPSLDSCVKNMQENFINCLVVEILLNKNIFGIKQEKYTKFFKNNIFDFAYMFRFHFWSNQYDHIDNESLRFRMLLDIDKIKKSISKEKFIELCEICFKDCLLKTIKEDNKSKSENLMKINYKFYRQLQEIKYEFENKYENVDFYDLLKYYASDKKRISF